MYIYIHKHAAPASERARVSAGYFRLHPVFLFSRISPSSHLYILPPHISHISVTSAHSCVWLYSPPPPFDTCAQRAFDRGATPLMCARASLPTPRDHAQPAFFSPSGRLLDNCVRLRFYFLPRFDHETSCCRVWRIAGDDNNSVSTPRWWRSRDEHLGCPMTLNRVPIKTRSVARRQFLCFVGTSRAKCLGIECMLIFWI